MCRVRPDSPPHEVHEPPMVQVTSEKPSAASPKSTTNEIHKKLGFIWAGVIVASVLITCTIVVIAVSLDIQRKQNKRNENNTLANPLALAVTDDNEKSEVGIISRNEWKSLQTKGDIPDLKPEIKYVIVCHTAGRFCETTEKCSAVVKWIQHHHISTLKKPDIIYNFILGGDGNIYEGRGWGKQNDLMDKSISIGVIGNFVYDTLTEEMIKKTKFFLNDGVRIGKLDENYFVVPHNQTRNTLSPGKNAYREIKTWSHYTNEYIVGN